MAKRGSRKVAAAFHVGFGDVKLSKSQQRQLASAIQSAALSELARMDVAPSGGLRFQLNPEWLGIWCERFRGGGGPIPDVGSGLILP